MRAIPPPLNIPPSLFWDGVDGKWSTFHVQVGTPGQAVRFLPGTSASASDTTWVVRPEGCSQANPNLTHCEDSRGLIFDPNKSTSWSAESLENKGLFELNTYCEGLLNLTGNAYYGFDTVTLGLPGSGLPSLHSQIVAGFATNNYWLGFLGLSSVPFNFSSQNDQTSLRDPQPSFLSELKKQSLIPSLSWGYTAGASYRDEPAFGSLVLGGYDSSRFVDNNVTFGFAADFSRDLTVYLRRISYDTLGSSPLLTEIIPVFINSLVSQLWLPREIYLVDDESHERLVNMNPTLTLTLGHKDLDSDTVDIVLPYGAFDLSGSLPFTNPPSRYFPLKRAEQPDQYTLGRVFLQGAYIVTDYERRMFSVSQVLFPDTSRTSNTTLVRIAPPEMEKTTGLSAGVVASVVVGCVTAAGFIAVALFFWLRRLRRTGENGRSGKADSGAIDESSPELDGRNPQRYELEHIGPRGGELDGVYTCLSELDPLAGHVVELTARNDSAERHELPGS